MESAVGFVVGGDPQGLASSIEKSLVDAFAQGALQADVVFQHAEGNGRIIGDL